MSQQSEDMSPGSATPTPTTTASVASSSPAPASAAASAQALPSGWGGFMADEVRLKEAGSQTHHATKMSWALTAVRQIIAGSIVRHYTSRHRATLHVTASFRVSIVLYRLNGGS